MVFFTSSIYKGGNSKALYLGSEGQTNAAPQILLLSLIAESYQPQQLLLMGEDCLPFFRLSKKQCAGFKDHKE